MATQKILVEYEVDASGFKGVQTEVKKTSDLVTDLAVETKAAFSGAAIDTATADLKGFNKEAEQSVTVFTNVKKELRELTKQINSEQLSGKALQQATKRAAELTDQIQDTSTAIKRLSSDTRIFDTLAEGARGVAAGFSIAQGAAGLFGEENADLQKTILKVQSSLALLNGAQEVANIITTKGGIATQAYGKAMQAVEFIQKQFAVSSAAVFGGIALGIGVAVTAIALLVNAYDDAKEKGEEYEQYLSDQQAKRLEQDEKTRTAYLSRLTKGEQDFIKQQEDDAKKRIASGENETLVRGRILQDRIAALKASIEASDALDRLGVRNAAESLAAEEAVSARKIAIFEAEIEYSKLVTAEKNRAAAEEKRLQDLAYKAMLQEIKDAEEILRLANDLKTVTLGSDGAFVQKFIGDLSKAKTDLGAIYSILTDKAFLFKLSDEEAKKALADFQATLETLPEAVVGIKVQPKVELDDKNQRALMAELEAFQSSLFSNFNSIVNNMTAANLQRISAEQEEQKAKLEDQEDAALQRYIGNEQKRTEIQALYAKKRERQEREFAYKKALLERQQAISNRDLALTNIAINFAMSASKTAADLGFPAAIPFLVLAAAQAGIQALAVSSAPIPDIPKFKDGVVDFKGAGNETSDSNLVYISNRESVINAKATKKNKAALEAINQDRFEHYVYNHILRPALQQSQIEKSLADAYSDESLKRVIKDQHSKDREMHSRNTKIMAEVIAEQAYINKKHFS